MRRRPVRSLILCESWARKLRWDQVWTGSSSQREAGPVKVAVTGSCGSSGTQPCIPTLLSNPETPSGMEKSMESKSMDRRLFVTTLFGAVGAAAFAAALPSSSQAVAKALLDDQAEPSVLPNLEDLQASPDAAVAEEVVDDRQQLAWHYGYAHSGRRRRRRRRVRRWRRICRREWWSGAYRRRCRRRPFWIWISIG
jgi:hypothetical protein